MSIASKQQMCAQQSGGMLFVCLRAGSGNLHLATEERYTKLMRIVHVLLVVYVIAAYKRALYRRFHRAFTSTATKMASMVDMDEVATASQTSRLLQQTNAWCGLNGLMYTDGKVNWTPAPLSLIPNVFASSSFNYATEVQPVISKLVDAISRDRDFLNSQLSSVSGSDAFTKRILDLYNEVPDEIIRDGLQCGVLRSDYMINHDNRPLQVEINTIASSFGYLSKKVSDYHRFMLERNKDRAELQAVVEATIGHALKENTAHKVASQNVVHNPSSVLLAEVIAAAHCEFNDHNAVVLFIVQPGERNVSKFHSQRPALQAC
jgi:hypothetical protein